MTACCAKPMAPINIMITGAGKHPDVITKPQISIQMMSLQHGGIHSKRSLSEAIEGRVAGGRGVDEAHA